MSALFSWVLAVAAYVYGLIVLEDERARLLFLISLPAGIAVVFMVLNLLAFPMAFSVFGNRLRTPLPVEAPRSEIRRSWVQVGYLFSTCPTVVWRVYPTGLGVHNLGNRKQRFISTQEIVSLDEFRPGRFRLRHRSAEVRNPILLPARAVKESLSVWEASGSISGSIRVRR